MRTHWEGKGAGLAEMTNLGLPVPPGFIITTDMRMNTVPRGTACRTGGTDAGCPVGSGEKVGKALGDKKNPLLSVRSGQESPCLDDGHCPQPRVE